MYLRSALPNNVRLLNGVGGTAPDLFYRHNQSGKEYLLDIDPHKLLLPYYLEAGRAVDVDTDAEKVDVYGGWEHPICQVRGHMLGHWLSAASFQIASTGDRILLAKVTDTIDELDSLQRDNGGEWISPIPERYFRRMAEGKTAWAPHYVIHKLFMGLLDVFQNVGNRRALLIADNFARWFQKWALSFDDTEFTKLLNYETGGMMEIWGLMYEFTGKDMYMELMNKYYRHELFDALLAGKDPLTNRHANTTIPEAIGVMKAYEVTGDEKWLDAALAYWDCAITNRGTFVTGGSSSEEMWFPANRYGIRLSNTTQEFCVEYNLMRLADKLYKATGDGRYTCFIERVLYNSVLAQHSIEKGTATYFLPLAPGSQKNWMSKYNHFRCCTGTMLQAMARLNDYIYYTAEDEIQVCQYVPSRAKLQLNGSAVNISQHIDLQMRDVQGTGDGEYATDRPYALRVHIKVNSEDNSAFSLRLRIPEWIAGTAVITLNGSVLGETAESGLYEIKMNWSNDRIILELPFGLSYEQVPDMPDYVAFMEGPVVLAGICDDEVLLHNNIGAPTSILRPVDEGGRGNNGSLWKIRYRTQAQANNILFKPLYEIEDEKYTVYFPVESNGLTPGQLPSVFGDFKTDL